MPENATPALDDTTFSIDDWINGATRPEDVIVLSSKGKEWGEYKALELELMKATRAADSTPDDDRLVTVANAEPVRIATQMDAKAKVIDKGRRPFHFRGISGPELETMRAETKDLDDEQTSTHILALCCIDPALTPAKWAEVRVALGEGQYTQAVNVAKQVTFGEAVSAPFSVAASVVLAMAAS
jgi:hypothetical protein